MSNRKQNKEIRLFEERFEPKEKEILILTGGSTGGAGKAGQEILWTCSQMFLAYVDCATKQFHEIEGRLAWLVEKTSESPFHFEEKTIFKVKVQPSNQTSDYFKLLEITDKNVANRDLSEFLTEFNKPVFINDDELGTFELDKEFASFYGQINWLGEEVEAVLEDADTVDFGQQALLHLKKITANVEEWNLKLKTFASEKLITLVNEWQRENSVTVSVDHFIERISLTTITITPDGDFTAFYDDDDLFFGHAILVEGVIGGQLSDAYIAG